MSQKSIFRLNFSSAMKQTTFTENLEIFVRILISQITSKGIFATLKIRLGHDLPTSVNDRMISSFREGFILSHQCLHFLLR